MILLSLAGVVVLGIGSGFPAPTHENLKVLPKNISNADLDSLMKSYERMLGVECKFCHIRSKSDPSVWDYASDEKPEKEIARKMMRMTEKINQEFFDYKMTYAHDEIKILAVSCKTCHHGSPRPELVED